MKPIVGKLLSAEGLRLRNFIFVVGKNQVFSASVQIEAWTEFLHRHHGTLDVPAWTARADRCVPRGFARLRSLPEREVSSTVFFVFVYVHARAVRSEEHTSELQ